MAFFGISLHLQQAVSAVQMRKQRSANAEKVQCMHCECREGTVKASRERRESPARTP